MSNTTNWLSISSMSGSSGQTILTLTAAQNLSATAKTAAVKAYNPVYNISAVTTVTLAQYSPSIEVSPALVGVPGIGGTYQLTICANCSYVIAYPDLVSSYSTSAGTGNTTITFTVPSTSSESTLVGNIVITDTSGQVSKLVRIEQYGSGVHISYSPSSITIPFSGGAATFTVTADCIYEIRKGSGTWYTVTPQTGYTGSTVFTVSSNTVNTGSSSWTSDITIIGPNGSAGTIALTQENQGSSQIAYTADTSNVAASGETRVITIDSTDFVNSSITVSVQGAPGATYTYEQTSLTRGTITVNFPENTGSPRDVTVIVTGRRALSTTTSSAVIVFPQNEYIVVPLPYTADTSTVDASGETRTITIDTTGLIESSITISVEGATGITYSYNNGVITVIFPENDLAPRDITINITGKTTNGDIAAATVVFEQDGYNIIPTGDSRLVVVYNVSSSTANTQIVDDSIRDNFIKIECPDGTDITNTVINSNGKYMFSKTGRHIVYYTLRNPQEINGGEGHPAMFIFGGDDPITDIVIPSSVTTIGDWCFGNLSQLTGVTLHSGLLYLGGFPNSTALRNISIPNTVTHIGQQAFSGCSALLEIVIPDSVLYLGANYNQACFSGCSSLSSVTIGSGVTQLGVSDYYNSTILGGLLFANCVSLSSITIPNNIEWVGVNCFSGCSSLTNVTFSSGSALERIGSGAFKNCTSLRSITIPNNVDFIGDSTFYGCTSLSSVTLNQNLIYLGKETFGDTGTFENCTNLNFIKIPYNVELLGQWCFRNCSGLTSMVFEATVPPSISRSTSLGSTDYTFPIYVPCEAVEAYKTAWDNQDPQVLYPTYVDRIKCAGSVITGLTLTKIFSVRGGAAIRVTCSPNTAEVNLIYSVSDQSIATVDSTGYITALSDGQVRYTVRDTISGLYAYEDVNVYMITYTAFYNVTSNTIPTRILSNTGVSLVSKAELNNSYSIPIETGYTFPVTGLVSITYTIKNSTSGNMFSNCSQLTDITVSGNVLSIPAGQFRQCSSLTSVTLPNINTLRSIEEAVFSGCSSLTNIVLPNNIQSIGGFGFYSCRNLENIVLPTSLTGLGEDCFNGCSSLTSVTIGNSCTYLSRNAFKKCTSLQSITFPGSITTMGTNCFSGCSSLTAITSLATVAPTISSNTFLEVHSNGTLYYPSGSDYSSWLSTGNYYLGRYGWTGQTI